MSYPIKSVLITGGTGSFGKAFISEIFKKAPELERLVIFSRDELKQLELSKVYPVSKYPQIRFFIGDIRDKERLKLALERIDIVVHAAALKQVPTAEKDPMEFIKTNIIGSNNLVEACLDSKVKRLIALSTDKAASPTNLYGATKLCADKLFVAANNLRGERDLRFSVVRYGNVMGSRGSVIPLFLNERNNNLMPITNNDMTRFNITLKESVDLVFMAIKKCYGGEIFVPKLPSYKITDVAKAIAPSIKTKIIGLRPGEKIHEELITPSDSYSTIDSDSHYIILPSIESTIEKYSKLTNKLDYVEKGFSYDSGRNQKFLSVNEIRKLIIENIDPKFKPL